jgi:ABC-type multidrug transport system ATPase subunit
MLHQLPTTTNSPTKALDKLCIALRPGECFALLGPNGAGKTTLISILCGLFAPTSGRAVVHSHSIPDDMEQIYKSMGYCPQFDILWEDLTIYEHMLYVHAHCHRSDAHWCTDRHCALLPLPPLLLLLLLL